MNDDDILDVIAHKVTEKTKGDPKLINASTTFDELGISSLDVMDVIFDVEEELSRRSESQVELADSDIAGQTVGDLVNAAKKAIERSREQQPPHHDASHGKHS
ncbi:MAG: Acyl carrier protein [Luteibacter sp.]|uniref:acyl carrier protein n=1 Tax=Luteibacter sp. TaxID=1886636 RepID=UPI00137DAD4C|nr:acyl carrier protein [Luteibacter sp.]KAF1007301.1 MAG: Acyl carrier protein [Luteibacter sp.]